ncbi:MAG TPA: hypothetical protein PLP39_06275 [Flavobacterium lutivivi]|nr:hypothetical protein [Flavobacterium lutivivi]
MKKIYFILFSFFTFINYAQVPQAISYQGIAYNSGSPVISPAVFSVRFQILKGDDPSYVLFEEYFQSVEPDSNGVFSLFIGTGFPTQTYFNIQNVDWALGSKLLKVDVDLSNGNNFTTPLGTSQLVTVPYAFYADKAKNIDTSAQSNYVTTVKNIYELRNFHDFDPEDPEVAKVVYVQGYHQSSDGGGGTFIFKKYVNGSINFNSLLPTEDYGCFIEPNENNPLKDIGIWVRQFDGEINVRYYGVMGYGQVIVDNVTINQRVQNAINFAAASTQNLRAFGHDRSNIVFFPNGDYKLSNIILKSGVELRGSSLEYTVINCTGEKDKLFELDSGVVLGFQINNMTIIGPEDRNKIVHGFFINPLQKDGKGGAGLWQSVFKNLNIFRFTGNAMYFEGGSSSTRYADPEVYNRLNQFNTFENVHAEGVGQYEINTPYHALQIVGLNGQFSFNNCRFDSGQHFGGNTPYDVNGIGVYIGSLKPNDILTPAIINFNTCSFQTGNVGVWIESANNINIYGSWFENLNTAVVVKGTYDVCKSINIMNNLFGVTDERQKQEYPMSVITYENAQINVMNNYITDYDQYKDYFNFIHLEPGPGGLTSRNLGATTIGNSFTHKPLNYSWGLKKEIEQSTITNQELVTENARLVQVKLNEDITINELSSYIAAGEMISITVDGGSITFKENRNLFLANMNNVSGPDYNGSIKVNHGGIITFIKVDEIVNRPNQNPVQYFETYHIVSYKNRE